jgi:crossover junction endodeoxyribonuclease RuvC
MRILGIDPGTRVLGFGLIEGEAADPRFSAAGCLKVPAREGLPARLLRIHQGLRREFQRLRPEAVAIEKAFHGRDPRALIALGEGRGIALLCAAESGVPIHEYSPAEIKKAVTGNGSARKDRVAAMVRVLLRVDLGDQPADVTDALAVALCHLQRGATERLLAAVLGSVPPRRGRIRRGRGR